MQFNTTNFNTNNNDLNENKTILSKYENTPHKNLTKSALKLNITSPVKHTISSLNKTRTKESIEREIQEKKEEREYGIIFFLIN